MLRCPLDRAREGARFARSTTLSQGRGEESAVLLRNETLNMNTPETINATEGPQPVHQPVKPIKFPNQPHEWKIISLRECPTPDEMQLCDEPDRAAAYWRTHVTADKHFNPDCECFVVLMLNTRRRIRGHYLVSIGTMDTILVHPREVFRLAIAANAHSLVLMHNHPSGQPEPSEADIKVTRDLLRAGQLLKIEVLDHVIIGNPGHASLRTLGFFYS